MTSRLASLNVKGLFGQFSYPLKFNQQEHITAILGPNGCGKTVCLKLIEALFRRRFVYFATVDFESLEFGFTSGEKIEITKLVAVPSAQRDVEHPKLPIKIRCMEVSGHSDEWQLSTPTIPAQRTEIINQQLAAYLTRVGPAEWSVDATGERLSIVEVVERYGTLLPPGLLETPPDESSRTFNRLLSETDCHLIETQRLLVFPSEDRRYVGGRLRASQFVVDQKASKLRDIIHQQLTTYATLSQQLDRSFPKRVIDHSSASDPDSDKLKDRLHELDEKRQELMNAGVLDKSFEFVTIEAEKIERTVAQVLEIYVDDTKRKLEVFDDLLHRIQLFQALISQRFTPKTIQIGRAKGYTISSPQGREIGLEKLSSGEQHQLVLLFELLFEVNERSLILIDEPELSLHVSWQKKFIDDLRNIIQLNKFDVVLATHSSALIGRWYDSLAVELGEVDG